MRILPDVLLAGPFWVGINLGLYNIKNCFDDILVIDISKQDAETLVTLLNKLTGN